MHSSLGSSSVTVTPSLTATSNSTIGTTSPTVVNSTTTKQGNSGGSSLLSKGGHRMTTVSIAKSVDHSVNQTATVSIGFGKNMTVPLAKITTWFDEYLQLYK